MASNERDPGAADRAAAEASAFADAGRWAEARERVRAARAGAASLPESDRRRVELAASATAVLVQWHTYGGDKEFRALFDELRTARARNELCAAHGPALYAIGAVQTRRGEFREAAATLLIARERLADDSPLWLAARAELALARLRGGDWSGAWAAIDAALVRAPAGPREAALHAALRLLKPAFSGDAAAVPAALGEARAALERGWSPLADALVRHAQTCLTIGRYAWGELRAGVLEGEDLGYRPMHLPDERRTLELLTFANLPDEAGLRGLTEEWGGAADASTSPYYWIARALVAELDDDTPAALAAAERSAASLTGREEPLGATHVLMTIGSIVARRVGPVEGMEWWERAREGLRRIDGADAFVELCTRVLEEHSRRIAEATGNPLNALTAQQRVVVDLVVEGRTSAEIANHLHLSRKTVDFHVANALARLGLRNRRELRAVRQRWATR